VCLTDRKHLRDLGVAVRIECVGHRPNTRGELTFLRACGGPGSVPRLGQPSVALTMDTGRVDFSTRRFGTTTVQGPIIGNYLWSPLHPNTVKQNQHQPRMSAVMTPTGPHTAQQHSAGLINTLSSDECFVTPHGDRTKLSNTLHEVGTNYGLNAGSAER
jgi:hypothetical protein